MPTRDAISWFKQHFQNDINTATAGTPYTLDMLTAIACQETGYIWDILRRRLASGQQGQCGDHAQHAKTHGKVLSTTTNDWG